MNWTQRSSLSRNALEGENLALEAEVERLKAQLIRPHLYHTCDLHPEDQCEACETERYAAQAHGEEAWESLKQRAERAEQEVERLKAEAAEAGRTAVNWHREFKRAEQRVKELEAVIEANPHHRECLKLLARERERTKRLIDKAVAACDKPCVCGSGKWPCHVDGDEACELVLELAALREEDRDAE